MVDQSKIGMAQAAAWMRRIIGPDRSYLAVAIVYGIAISLLSLATPISVQLLINSVANIALPTPLFTLSAILFILLLIVVVLSALRVHLMFLFERRVFARTVAEITLEAVQAKNPFFADANRTDLFNRYFDLVTVQKAVPSLIIGGFTILLQSAVGLIVTSFYHPFFLAFNGVLIASVYLIWRLWSRGAIQSAVALSHAKHETARWLESVGGSNGFYKSSRHLDFAMDRSETVTATYVDQHRRHFRATFAQTLAYLLLYAVASAALLALGGWLIIQNQLSIGQLVAAELILSGVFYGISQLGGYLESFYDLIASCEELSLLHSIPGEEVAAGAIQHPTDGAVVLRNVEAEGLRLNLTIEAGAQLVMLATPSTMRTLALLLKRHLNPTRGLVMVGGTDLGSLDLFGLRSDVVVLDRPTIVDVSIREFLTLAQSDTRTDLMLDALAATGLERSIAKLPDGLDTHLSQSGWPLSIGEVMALKLAAALLSRPRVLVLSTLYDLLPIENVRHALERLRAVGTTVLLSTARPEDITLDGYVWIGPERQPREPSLHALLEGMSPEEVADAVQA